ncbi:hypothetical protein [Bosea sp. TAF32]|uniref:hypothetical protein n=1 Tax=Bosea sp. TAF32 TaxID=3237482 RepID=UPI003F914129
MLVRGEALVGATVDHFRAFDPDAVKAGIVWVYPSEGMPLATAPVAIFKDAPNRNAARLASAAQLLARLKEAVQ